MRTSLWTQPVSPLCSGLGTPGHNTRTYMFDMTDLDKPVAVALPPYEAEISATDHDGNLAYQANYTAGLHVLDISDLPQRSLKQVGSFDSIPNADGANMRSAWTAFPFFESGIVIMHTNESGMFVLKPQPSVLGADAVKP